MLFEPIQNGDEMNAAQEIQVPLVVPRADASIAFDSLKEVFDLVAPMVVTAMPGGWMMASGTVEENLNTEGRREAQRDAAKTKAKSKHNAEAQRTQRSAELTGDSKRSKATPEIPRSLVAAVPAATRTLPRNDNARFSVSC